jgi:hypothetical protein
MGKDPGTHLIRGWVGPKASRGKEKDVTSAGIQTPDRPARSLVTILTELYQHLRMFSG